jgi:hypothetical protein
MVIGARQHRMRAIEDTNKLATSTNGFLKQLMSTRWGKSELLIIEKSKKTYKIEIDNYGRLSKEINEKLRTTNIEINENASRQDNLISFEVVKFIIKKVFLFFL